MGRILTDIRMLLEVVPPALLLCTPIPRRAPGRRRLNLICTLIIAEQIHHVTVLERHDVVEIPHALGIEIHFGPVRLRALSPEQCAQDNAVGDVFVQVVIESGAEAPTQSQPRVAAHRPQLESVGVVEREPNGIVVA